MPVESLFPRLEPLLAKVSKPIQYVGGELNSTVKDWDACDVRWALDVPRRLRGRRAEPGRHDPLRGPQRGRGRPGRAHLRGVAGHGGPDARAPGARVHRRRAPPGRRLRRARRLLRHRARLHQHAADAGPRRHPAARRWTAPRSTRWSSRAATRRSTRSRWPTSSTPRCSATASRPCSRSARSIRAWKAEGRPGGRARAAAAAGPHRRRLRARRSTTSSTSPTAGSSGSPRTRPACRGGSASTP